MKADAIATRMSVLTRALPLRILLVDDDELELELIADRLTDAGFEVKQASNGQQALEVLTERWYPLVITDWQMPVMDGLQFSESLRARGEQDTYIIMLTMRDSNLDFERAYASGVDDYLTKKVPDAELFARINAAFNTLALRRSLRQAQDALENSSTIDASTGVLSNRELRTRLHSEVLRAQRYGRQLTVITVGAKHADDAPISDDTLRGVAQTLSAAVRAHVDWVARLGEDDEASFAVVLPEANVGDGPAIKNRLFAALNRFAQAENLVLNFSSGLGALERHGPGGPSVEASVLLNVAEHCRSCSGRVGMEQLIAIKQSVAGHVAIPCRQGYAVATECPLHPLP
jgi:two-component system, cell cycle response regulator